MLGQERDPSGRYWVGWANFVPEVTEGWELPPDPIICDSTIRKILLTTGTRPPIKGILRVAEALAEAGVKEMIMNVSTAGDPIRGDELEFRVLREVLAGAFGFHVGGFTDSVMPFKGWTGYDAIDAPPVELHDNVARLAEIGVDAIHVAVSDPVDRTAREVQQDQLLEVYSHLKGSGVAAVPLMIDVGRMDFEYMIATANAAIDVGANRIELAETYSTLSPDGTRAFLRRLKAELHREVDLVWHIHDDFGLGSSAAIAAATAGAHPDVAVNGISYRAGFAALEEVVLGLELLYGVNTGINLGSLKGLSDLVYDVLGFPRNPLKSVTGDHAFVRDLPLWVLPLLQHGLDAIPAPASCFAPSLVGSQFTIVWTFHHSDYLVQAKLQQLGLQASHDQIAAIRKTIDSRLAQLTEYPIWLEDREVDDICRATVAGEDTQVGGERQVQT